MKPIQADRNAAADFLRTTRQITGSEYDAILRGKWDDTVQVQWFMQRRKEESAQQAMIRVNLLLMRRSITAAREKVDDLAREARRPTWRAINMLDHALKAVLGTSGALLKDIGEPV